MAEGSGELMRSGTAEIRSQDPKQANMINVYQLTAPVKMNNYAIG